MAAETRQDWGIPCERVKQLEGGFVKVKKNVHRLLRVKVVNER